MRATTYELKVPVGTGDLFRSRLAEAPADSLSALQWHTVKRGESLGTIARKLHVSTTDLAAANFLTTRSRVSAGQQLIIPRAPTTLLAARTETPAPAAPAAVAHAVASEKAPVRVVPASARVEPQRIVYRVRRGDTLFSIAQLYDTTVAALKNWNRSIVGSRIHVGDRLTIVTTRTRAASN